jgi:hypothetical protein
MSHNPQHHAGGRDQILQVSADAEYYRNRQP